MGNKLSLSIKKKFNIKNNETDSSHTSSESTEKKPSQASHISYWFPNHYEELDRLSSQHFALKVLFEGNVSNQILSKIDLNSSLVLDLGCGPGTWIMDVATEYPGSKFHGIDIYEIFPNEIRPPNVEFQVHDALQGIPFPDNTFDLVHLRMFIISVEKNEWPIIIREIYRVLKPGGFIQCCEAGMIDQGSDFVLKIGKAFTKTITDRGQDPYIGIDMEKTLEKGNFNVLEFEKKEIDYSKKDMLTKDFLWIMVQLLKSCRPEMEPRISNSSEPWENILEKFQEGLQMQPASIWTIYRCVGQK
ncbi:S-adenosyl-L-methionine-dependent methyltransferase [Sporodiniella umbellata]|nr:S-adenosyl-L-methionine-dependent methyltransferase [Sporodiniella umbellata]